MKKYKSIYKGQQIDDAVTKINDIDTDIIDNAVDKINTIKFNKAEDNYNDIHWEFSDDASITLVNGDEETKLSITQVLGDVTIETRKDQAVQLANVENGRLKINMGQLNFYINGLFLRSFAPGLGGSKQSKDTASQYKGDPNKVAVGLESAPASFGSFALNFADSDYTYIKLTSKDNMPTIQVELKPEFITRIKNLEAAVKALQQK